MDVDNNIFTIKQIQRLMVLYSKAVEFYNGKSDSKYIFYQEKLQNLISQDKVLDLLNAKVNNNQEREPPKKEKVKADRKTKEELKEKERRMKMNLHLTNQEIK